MYKSWLFTLLILEASSSAHQSWLAEYAKADQKMQGAEGCQRNHIDYLSQLARLAIENLPLEQQEKEYVQGTLVLELMVNFDEEMKYKQAVVKTVPAAEHKEALNGLMDRQIMLDQALLIAQSSNERIKIAKDQINVLHTIDALKRQMASHCG